MTIKASTHHTIDAKIIVRFRAADLTGKARVEVIHGEEIENEFVYARSFSLPSLGVANQQPAIYISDHPLKLGMWEAKPLLTFLKDSKISFEQTLVIKELRGTTTPLATGLGSLILERLPANLCSLVGRVILDNRRYLVVTTGTRSSLNAYRGSIIRASRNDAVLMMNDGEEAIALKLKHGGSVYDMDELRAKS